MAEEKQLPFLYMVFMFVTVVLIFGGAAWILLRYDIMNGIRWLCIGELYLIDIFVNDDKIPQIINFLKSFEKRQLAFDGILNPALFYCGNYMKYVFAPLFIWWFVNVFLHSPKKMLRSKMLLDDIIKYQSKVWPYVKPFVDYDPGKESSRKMGDPVPKKLKPFAESLSPEEWVIYNNVDINTETFEFNEAQAKKQFQAQLGKRWRGIKNIPDYALALFAAFSMKGARKREEADEFLGEISGCWTRKNGLKLTKKVRKKIRQTIKDKDMGQAGIQIANNHAYFVSAMLGTLDWARKKGGVLAPSQFAWLRGEDRNLWYALNSLGRRTYFSEGSGAISHYYTEKNMQQPVTAIQVDTAIQALQDYLEDQCPEIPTKE